MLDDFGPAIAELTWFHSSADASLDVRGQSTEGGGGSAVFDEEASARLHGRRLTKKWRYDIDKRERIAATLARVTPESRRAIEKAFVPSGEPKSHVDAYFTVAGVRLYRLAKETAAAREAFEKKKADAKRPAYWTIADWFDEHSKSLQKMKDDLQRLRSNKPALGAFEHALNSAVTALAAALTEYEPHRKERVKIELTLESRQMSAELDVLVQAERDLRNGATALDEMVGLDIDELLPIEECCPFTAMGMVCVLRRDHGGAETALGGHQLVREDIVDRLRIRSAVEELKSS